MDRPKLVIGGAVCAVVLLGLGVYWWQRGPFTVYASRITNEIPVTPGTERFAARHTVADPGKFQLLIVTVKVNRGVGAMRTSDFTLRYLSNQSEQTARCSGLCPVDDPEHPGALWMVAEGNEDILVNGIKSGYLHLAFLVPLGTRTGALRFKQERIGRVEVKGQG